MNYRTIFAQAVEEEECLKARHRESVLDKQAQAAFICFKSLTNGVEPDRVEVEDKQVIVHAGDVTLLYTNDSWPYFRVRGNCPRCNVQTWSQPCYTAADIGNQLQAFVPSSQAHACEAEPEPEHDWLTEAKSALNTVSDERAIACALIGLLEIAVRSSEPVVFFTE